MKTTSENIGRRKFFNRGFKIAAGTTLLSSLMHNKENSAELVYHPELLEELAKSRNHGIGAAARQQLEKIESDSELKRKYSDILIQNRLEEMRNARESAHLTLVLSGLEKTEKKSQKNKVK